MTTPLARHLPPWPADPALRAGTLDLYGAVWRALPAAIRRAASWGVDWFAMSHPVLLCESDRVVAHVGVTLLQLHLEGALTDVPALHAVCVAPDARGRGLGRAALESALAAVDAAGYPATLLWSERTALYERFGFTTRRESAWIVPAPASAPAVFERLDPDHAPDLARLRSALRSRRPLSRALATADDGALFLLNLAIHCAARRVAPSDLLLELPEHGCVLVAEAQATTLRILDLVATEPPPLEVLVGAATRALAPPGGRFETIHLDVQVDDWRDAAHLEACSSEDLLMVRGRASRALAASGPPLAFAPFAKT